MQKLEIRNPMKKYRMEIVNVICGFIFGNVMAVLERHGEGFFAFVLLIALIATIINCMIPVREN